MDNLPKLVHTPDNLELCLLKIPLKQDKATYKHRSIVKIYIVYKLITGSINTGITLHNSLFGVVKLTKNAVLINTNILDMVLDLIQEEVFHIQAEDIVEMLI